ncbi:MAG: hypothetical protein LBK53_00350 [Heliobacteriaceae bacterium]|jgi:type II secretory pathway pseudopilin PulG|nr:hypothetical protein [Heliobacteriaceae bacterium]
MEMQEVSTLTEQAGLHCRQTKLCFTLAEVLITLSVIGVVAVLTMPQLIANWQAKSYSTAKEVFDRRLEEATRQMNIKEALTGYTTTQAFVDELKKYLKILQVCETDPSNCFAPAITNSDGSETVETKDLKNSSNLNKGNWGTKALGITILNGYTIILSYNPDCPVLDISAAGSQTTSCLSLVYDINGKAKPNKLGKDVYTLNANPFDMCGGIKIGNLCVSGNNPAVRAINTCNDTTWDSHGTSNSACANNYWAGAKQACAEQGMRLPTIAELQSIVSSGEKLPGWVWSSEEYSANTAYHISSGIVGYGSGYKGNQNVTKCVK